MSSSRTIMNNYGYDPVNIIIYFSIYHPPSQPPSIHRGTPIKNHRPEPEYMHFPPFLRTLTYTNTTALSILRFPTTTTTTTVLHRLSQAPITNRTTLLRSMPSIPFLGSFFSSISSSQSKKDMTDYPIQKGEDEWQAVLSREQFRVIREKGTEAPYTGEYDKHMPSEGTYECAACHAPLYRATHKFKSGCGWPAYFDSLPGAVTRHTDSTLGMSRTEITCSQCGGHLGHIFKGEGYPTPTDERHCVNSVSLKFAKEEGGK